jgi:hypothetical protein
MKQCRTIVEFDAQVCSHQRRTSSFNACCKVSFRYFAQPSDHQVQHMFFQSPAAGRFQKS